MPCKPAVRYAIAFAVVAAIVAAAITWRRRRAAATAGGEKFLEAMAYNPCTLDPLGPEQRSRCGGFTSGLPPSIDTEQAGGWLCAGQLGVPI